MAGMAQTKMDKLAGQLLLRADDPRRKAVCHINPLKTAARSMGHLEKLNYFRFYSIYGRSHTQRLHTIVNA